jgi:hypothetical protein
MIVQPGILSAEFGASGDQIEADHTVDADVLRQSGRPCLLCEQPASGSRHAPREKFTTIHNSNSYSIQSLMPGQEQIKGSFDGTKELGRKFREYPRGWRLSIIFPEVNGLSLSREATQP